MGLCLGILKILLSLEDPVKGVGSIEGKEGDFGWLGCRLGVLGRVGGDNGVVR